VPYNRGGMAKVIDEQRGIVEAMQSFENTITCTGVAAVEAQDGSARSSSGRRSCRHCRPQCRPAAHMAPRASRRDRAAQIPDTAVADMRSLGDVATQALCFQPLGEAIPCHTEHGS
jgi:hypothetical protein